MVEVSHVKLEGNDRREVVVKTMNVAIFQMEGRDTKRLEFSKHVPFRSNKSLDDDTLNLLFGILDVHFQMEEFWEI